MFFKRTTTTRVRLGAVDVVLTTTIGRLRRDYTRLYRESIVDAVPDDAIHIDVARSGGALGLRRRFDIRVNGRLRFSPYRYEELLPYVEWSVNWEIPHVMPQYLHLHAASMELDGRGLVLAGDAGSGKSTLALGLMRHGWRYLCDEFALIDTNSLSLTPYPRAVCVKRSGYPILDAMGVAPRCGRRHIKGVKGHVTFVSPHSIHSDAVGRACPVRCIVFPRYEAGATPVLAPISRARAAFNLHRVCFNLFGCRRPALDMLAGIARGAECYQLRTGDLDDTCRLLTDVVRSETTASRCA